MTDLDALERAVLSLYRRFGDRPLTWSTLRKARPPDQIDEAVPASLRDKAVRAALTSLGEKGLIIGIGDRLGAQEAPPAYRLTAAGLALMTPRADVPG